MAAQEQLFVYAIVTSVSVPCVATLAALAGELGWRTALAMCGATLALAIGVGGILARLLGVVWPGRRARPAARSPRRSCGRPRQGLDREEPRAESAGGARRRGRPAQLGDVEGGRGRRPGRRDVDPRRQDQPHEPRARHQDGEGGERDGQDRQDRRRAELADREARRRAGHEAALGPDQVDAAGEAEEPLVRGEHAGRRARRDDDRDAEEDEPGASGLAGKRQEPEEDAAAAQDEREAQGSRGRPAVEQAADDGGGDERRRRRRPPRGGWRSPPTRPRTLIA